MSSFTALTESSRKYRNALTRFMSATRRNSSWSSFARSPNTTVKKGFPHAKLKISCVWQLAKLFIWDQTEVSEAWSVAFVTSAYGSRSMEGTWGWVKLEHKVIQYLLWGRQGRLHKSKNLIFDSWSRSEEKNLLLFTVDYALIHNWLFLQLLKGTPWERNLK